MVEAMEQMDSLRFGRLNHEFHAVFHERCPNAALVDLLRDVARRLDAIRRTVFVQIPYRGAASVAEHRALIELIGRHAPAAEIEAAAREHKLHTVESFRALEGRASALSLPADDRTGAVAGRPPGLELGLALARQRVDTADRLAGLHALERPGLALLLLERAPCATSSAIAAGTTITPSASPTITSPGITSTPPHAIGTFDSSG